MRLLERFPTARIACRIQQTPAGLSRQQGDCIRRHTAFSCIILKILRRCHEGVGLCRNHTHTIPIRPARVPCALPGQGDGPCRPVAHALRVPGIHHSTLSAVRQRAAAQPPVQANANPRLRARRLTRPVASATIRIADGPKWWNWQTRCVQGAVGTTPVWVRIPPSAPAYRRPPGRSSREASIIYANNRIRRLFLYFSPTRKGRSSFTLFLPVAAQEV